jgi:hypothetical protein
MAREIFFNDRLAFDARVGARGARLRVTEALLPEPPFTTARPRGREHAYLIWTQLVPLFDIVNVEKQAGGIPFGAAAVCSFRRVG